VAGARAGEEAGNSKLEIRNKSQSAKQRIKKRGRTTGGWLRGGAARGPFLVLFRFGPDGELYMLDANRPVYRITPAELGLGGAIENRDRGGPELRCRSARNAPRMRS
jgi:hypothetical protein